MAADETHDGRTQSFVALTAGTTISQYRIIEKIGAGGMGEVYLALDTRLNRKVALKFLPPHLCQDGDCRKRFIREAQAAAGLDHPNIAAIHEVGEYRGRPYYSMQVVEGQALRDVIAAKNLSIERILEIAVQLCEGLQAAHSRGIIHRDIKPSNILLDNHGRVRIVDFGLASIRGFEHLTKTGSTLGTIGYMSPEQIQAIEVDQRGDLFSFGVVLYEMIAGCPPFTGDTDAAIMKAVLNDAAEPLSRYKSGVSDRLQDIVSKLLEKDRDLRYQSAAGVISDLKRLRRDSDRSLISHPPIFHRRKTARYLIPAAIVALATTALLLRPWDFGKQPGPEVLAAANRLAIMYFDNLADPPDSQKLGEIATNLLITDLSESHYVQVVSNQRLYDILKLLGREGAKRIDRSTASQVAEKAHAKWMLQGSILRMEPEIELTAQIIEVSSGNTVAGQRIKGTPGESIFSLIDKLTVAVKSDLSLPEAAMTEKDQPVAEVTTQSPEAYRYYLEGVENGLKFYFSEAEQDFQKAVELDSTFAMAYYRLSQLSSGVVQREKLAKALQFSKNVNDHERMTIEAYSAFVNGDGKTAIEKCNEVLKRFPDDKEMYVNLGHIQQVFRQDVDSAIYFFSKVLQLDSLYGFAYNALAYGYNDIGDFDKSIWAINKYTDLSPNQANPYDSRADLYAAAGKIDEAIASYRKAIEIKPDFYMSWEKLGYLHVYRLEYDEAGQCFEVLMESPDKNVRSDARRDIALTMMYRGKLGEALDILKQGIATDRMEKAESWEKHFLTARIYVELGEVHKALTAMRQAIENYPVGYLQIVPITHFYIQTLAEGGRIPEARKALTEWKNDILQNNTAALVFWWIGAGCLERAMGNDQLAINYFRSTVDRLKSPRLPFGFHAHFLLACAYQNNGQLGEAVNTFERMLSDHSNGRIRWAVEAAKLHYYLGMAYEESGWIDKAVEQYRTFLNIWENADPGLAAVTDANRRLTRLENSSKS